jgi:hypothetical protein
VGSLPGWKTGNGGQPCNEGCSNVGIRYDLRSTQFALGFGSVGSVDKLELILYTLQNLHNILERVTVWLLYRFKMCV